MKSKFKQACMTCAKTFDELSYAKEDFLVART